MSKQKNKNNMIHEEGKSTLASPPLNDDQVTKSSIKSPKNTSRKILFMLILPLQLFIFLSILIILYKDQRIKPQFQEKIQGSSIEQLVGPQVINLENNEGDPRLSWFDPGATLFFKGFVNGVDEKKISLVGSDQVANDIPLAKDKTIACVKEQKSACPCTDDCTLEDVASSISVSVHNYYESVDMPDGTVEDQIVSSSIFIE